MGDAAMAIAKYLHLHMARALQVFLQQHAIIAKGGLGLAPRAGQFGGKILRPQHRAHALAAAARTGLDQHGKANARGLRGEQRLVLTIAVIARHGRHPGRHHDALGFRLAAHGANGRGRGADETNASRRASLSKFGVFGQKPIARMDGLSTRTARNLQDRIAAQIGLCRWRRANRVCLIRLPHMQRRGISLRKDGNAAQTHPPRGANNAAGNLATIGDQERFEHHIRNSPKRVSEIGDMVAAARDSPKTSRVAAGGIMPSSHSRAVA